MGEWERVVLLVEIFDIVQEIKNLILKTLLKTFNNSITLLYIFSCMKYPYISTILVSDEGLSTGIIFKRKNFFQVNIFLLKSLISPCYPL